MVLGFGNKTFFTNPVHYATPWQPSGGAPSSKTDAARLLKSYDYGTLLWHLQSLYIRAYILTRFPYVDSPRRSRNGGLCAC